MATDIAARGIHVDDIALVVHVDPPAEHKAYLHRCGRTARAGAEGVVVTIMTPDQAGDVKSLARAAKIEPIITRVAPGHSIIDSLVGEPAPRKAVTVHADRQPGRNDQRRSVSPAGAPRASRPSRPRSRRS